MLKDPKFTYMPDGEKKELLLELIHHRTHFKTEGCTLELLKLHSPDILLEYYKNNTIEESDPANVKGGTKLHNIIAPIIFF